MFKLQILSGNLLTEASLKRINTAAGLLAMRTKQFRAIATRYDKLKRNYESMVALACGVMWWPM